MSHAILFPLKSYTDPLYTEPLIVKPDIWPIERLVGEAVVSTADILLPGLLKLDPAV